MKKTGLLIAGTIGLAVALRCLGIWHGYPYSYYPDESHFVKRALAFGSFDFNPHWFHKPALFMYLLFFEYGVLHVIGKIMGLWSSVEAFGVYYITDPGVFYLIGRLTVTLFGVATIWLTYRIGEKHFQKPSGIAAALLLAVSYGHVDACQDIKADVPATFFTVLSALFLLNFLESARPKDAILAAVSAGAGAATKVYPIVMLVPIVVSFFLLAMRPRPETGPTSRCRWSKTSALLWSGGAVLVFWSIYFVCSPYSFLDPLGRGSTFKHFHAMSAKIASLFGAGHVAPRDPGAFIGERLGYFAAVLDYLEKIVERKGMGMPIGILALLGTLTLCVFQPGRRKAVIFLLFPLAFVILSIVEAPGYASVRHQLPIYPFLAMSGGAMIACLWRKNPFSALWLYGVLLVCLAFPLYAVLERGLFVAKTDSRNVAKVWIEANVPDGTKIVMDENGPPLLSSAASLRGILKKARGLEGQKGQFTAHYGRYLHYQILAAAARVSYGIDEIRRPWWRKEFSESGKQELDTAYDRDMANPLRPVGVHPYQWYVKNGFRFAIVHSHAYRSFFKENSATRKRFPSFAAFYADLFRNGTLVKEFPGEAGGRPGPTVKLFALTSGAPATGTSGAPATGTSGAAATGTSGAATGSS